MTQQCICNICCHPISFPLLCSSTFPQAELKSNIVFHLFICRFYIKVILLVSNYSNLLTNPTIIMTPQLRPCHLRVHVCNFLQCSFSIKNKSITTSRPPINIQIRNIRLFKIHTSLTIVQFSIRKDQAHIRKIITTQIRMSRWKEIFLQLPFMPFQNFISTIRNCLNLIQ